MAQRLDKWLWHARFFKTRSLAAKVIKEKRIRLNGQIVAKPSVMVSAEDTLAFIKADQFRVIIVKDEVERRVGAPLAAALYEDHSPPPERYDPLDPRRGKTPSRERGMGRPTKADRRAINKLQRKD